MVGYVTAFFRSLIQSFSAFSGSHSREVESLGRICHLPESQLGKHFLTRTPWFLSIERNFQTDVKRSMKAFGL